MDNENTDLQGEIEIDNATVGLTEKSLDFILETAKWTKLLSIVGFVLLGMMILVAVSIGSIFSYFIGMFGSDILGSDYFPPDFPFFSFSGIYIVFAIIYFFPIYYLFQFSNKVTQAINQKDILKLENGFENLKMHYKFVGILTLVVMSFYVLVIGITGIVIASF